MILALNQVKDACEVITRRQSALVRRNTTGVQSIYIGHYTNPKSASLQTPRKNKKSEGRKPAENLWRLSNALTEFNDDDDGYVWWLICRLLIRMVFWIITAYLSHDVIRDGMNLFRLFWIYLTYNQVFSCTGHFMPNTSTTCGHKHKM